MAERNRDEAEELDHRWIAEAAYFRWLARGSQHGGDQEDWWQAKQDLVLHRWFGSVDAEHPCFTFLALSQLAYAFGVIDDDELLERAAYHRDLFHADLPDDEPPREPGNDKAGGAPEEDMDRPEGAAHESGEDAGGS